LAAVGHSPGSIGAGSFFRRYFSHLDLRKLTTVARLVDSGDRELSDGIFRFAKFSIVKEKNDLKSGVSMIVSGTIVKSFLVL
jgi:hypothetical protein